MIIFLYCLNIAILFSGLLGFRMPIGDKRFSLSLLRILAMLPLLAVTYYYLTLHPDSQTIPLVFFSESIFALVWFTAAYWLNRAAAAETDKVDIFPHIEVLLSIGILGVGFFYTRNPPAFLDEGRGLMMNRTLLLFSAHFFLLISMVAMAWRMESFWMGLSAKQRWEYKYLAAGSYLLCGALGWAVSYRYTYHRMGFDHFRLLAALLLFSWLMMGFAVVRHRLLNRKIFVSRKVVYAFVAPMTFGIYLMAIGLVVLLMRMFDVSFPLVLRWLLIVFGLFVVGVMAVSGKVRHAVKYFVSTHFYTNKYEYRDEWLAFSRLLQGSLNESEVVNALQETLSQSLYTKSICIWTGDEDSGYRLAFHSGVSISQEKDYSIAGNQPVISALQSDECFHVDAQACRDEQIRTSEEKPVFSELNLVLFTPLSIGEQMFGVIGLGPEFTGGRYGQDDFDLLTALGTQAASALMAARMAEKLAKARQQEAWDAMSAFVLHDVKNAASMLSLMRQNAPKHLDDPEFQADMLETIDDALQRMGKVQNRLSVMKREIVPEWQTINLFETVRAICGSLKKRLHGLEVELYSNEEVNIINDPGMLKKILENLLINSLEAGANHVIIDIRKSCEEKQSAVISVKDNGSGIPSEFLPDAIFDPFITTKSSGSGIGLWQVKRFMSLMGGSIDIQRHKKEKILFIMRFPIEKL